jgi:hypothetical protein
MLATGVSWAGLFLPTMMVGGASTEEVMMHLVLSFSLMVGGYQGMNQDP